MRRKKNEDTESCNLTDGLMVIRHINRVLGGCDFKDPFFSISRDQEQSVCSSKWHLWQLNLFHITAGEDKDGDKTVAAHAKKVIEASN